MKKSCGNCKAYIHCKCELGYNIEVSKKVFGTVLNHRPLQECEKPKNNNDFIALLMAKKPKGN